MDNLPYEIRFNIILNLSACDIINFSITNKKYLDILNDWIFWSYKAKILFNFPIEKFYVKNQTPMLRYMTIYNLLQSIEYNFLKCIATGNLNHLEILLNYVDPSIDGNRAIIIATRCKFPNILERLLKDHRIDPSDVNIFPKLTDISSSMGDLDTLKILLNDPRLNSIDNYKFSLEIAASTGRVEVVNFLLSRLYQMIDKDTSLKNTVYNAFRCSVSKGHVDIVKTIIDNEYYIPKDIIHNAMLTACIKGYELILQELLKIKNIDPSFQKNECIIKASSEGNYEVVKILLHHPKVNPAARHNLALKLACSNGRDHVVEILLKDNRVDLNDRTDGYSALMHATINNKFNTVKLLLNNKEMDPTDYEALDISISKKYFDISKLILNDDRTNLAVYTNERINNLLDKCGSNSEIYNLIILRSYI